MNKDVMVHTFLFFVENTVMTPSKQPGMTLTKALAYVDSQKVKNFLWRFQGPDSCGTYKETPAEVPPEEMEIKVSDREAFHMVHVMLSKVMEKKYDSTLVGGTHLDPYTTTIAAAVNGYAKTCWIGDERIAEILVTKALRYVDVMVRKTIEAAR